MNSNNAGWFAVSRLIFSHELIGIRGRAYTEFEAWLWLLAQASFEQCTVNNKGHTIILDPGQLMHARTYLAHVWQWSEDKVRWFLKRLETEAMITRILICNYGDYQVVKGSEDGAQEAAEITPSNTPSKNSQSHPASTQQNTNDIKDLLDAVAATAPSQHPATHPASHPQVNNITKDIDICALASGPEKAGKDLIQWAFGAYNEVAARRRLPRANKLTKDRERALKARLAEYGREGWERALANIERSAFLQGRTRHGFFADLDFMLQPSKFSRLHDGGYGNGAHAAPAPTADDRAFAEALERRRLADEEADERCPP
jgi:hypothetical protein